MKENLKMILKKDMDYYIIIIEIYMKEIGKITKWMDMEQNII